MPNGIFSNIDVKVYNNYLKVDFKCAFVKGETPENVTGYYYGNVDELLTFVQLSKSVEGSLEADLKTLLNIDYNTDIFNVPFDSGTERYNNIKNYLEEKLESYNQSRTAFERITLTDWSIG